MRPFLLVVASALLALPATLQAQSESRPTTKSLSRTECALIEKKSDGKFYVRGPVQIGDLKLEDQDITPDGFSVDGTDVFVVIQRSCFNGRPS